MPNAESYHIPYGAPPPGYSGPRRSLILAGGGMRVAYQAGAIRALFEAGLCFSHADGTSGGTMNLAMLFSGHSPVEMCNRWSTLNVREFVSYMPLQEYLKGSAAVAMGDADGIVGKVFPHLGIDVEKINSARGMMGTFNVCNYTRKTNEAIPHDQVDLQLLVAGISLPIFMPPVQRDGFMYTDSVWIKDANLMEAVRRGADELWVVWCIGNTSEYKGGVFNQYVHMIELSANGALFEEFDRINEINDRILHGEKVYGHDQPVKLHVIKPDYPLPLDPDLYLGRIDTATLISLGYTDALNYVSSARPEGLPFIPEVTKMQDTTLGFTFREMMTGAFALGETDPRAGETKGRAGRTFLSMHATINISDLKRFIVDPDHTGSISGSVDFPSFGGNIPTSKGIFNLFSPTDNPKMKYMVYELGFDHGGSHYYLAGKKEVRNNSGFDLWSDTTTLYTTLHKGVDATGPVVGAGILRLSPGELLKMVPTMHATSARSTAEGAGALLEFGRFFLGKLWETYAGSH